MTLEHADYDRIEEELNKAVAASLGPRGPDVLYDVVGGLGLPAGARVIDVGCGAGRQAVELARRYSFDVLGIDPSPRFEDAAGAGGPVAFELGTAEAVPAPDASADLVLYRELLYVVADLGAVLAECRRVLRPEGRAIVYQLFNTDWLEPEEAARFWGSPSAAAKAGIGYFESSVDHAGLVVDQMLDLKSETVEWAEERDGKAARELLAAARLLRDPDRYAARFGREACDIKFNDALWFVYRMIGKLTQRLYVLRPG